MQTGNLPRSLSNSSHYSHQATDKTSVDMSWADNLIEKWSFDSSKTKSLPVPPAFNVQTHSTSTKKSISKKSDDASQLKLQRAWEIAIAPGKSLPMNIFMSWMSGSSLQIVPLTMTFMMFFVGPMKQILSVNSQFQHLYTSTNGPQILTAKIIFIILQFAFFGAGLYKLSTMGLLPNTKSDFLAWEVPAKVSEIAY